MSIIVVRYLLFAFAFTLGLPSAVHAQSMLRVTCEGEDVGAEVSINGKVKGTCPVDMLVEPGTLKLRLEKKVAGIGERVFEQEIPIGTGVRKKVEAILTLRVSAEWQRREAERLAAEAASREQEMWQMAQSADQAPAVQAYLDKYPKGKFFAAAQDKLTAIRKSDAEMRPGKVYKDCADCPEMVVIPAGSFVMGVVSGEEEREQLPNFRDLSQPQHSVNVASFSAGKFEVTRGQYQAFAIATGLEQGIFKCYVWTRGEYDNGDRSIGWRNPGYAQDDQHPVACVHWIDAMEYVKWLSKKTGKSYRLLTEAEWEYAARAGTTTARYWGDDGNLSCAYANGLDLTAKAQVPEAASRGVANCDDRYAYTAPVGSYKANPFGLYDMLGNAWEWTADCWHENYVGAPTDGSMWLATPFCERVARGGSWSGAPAGIRSAHRFHFGMAYQFNNIGFRVARTH